MDCYIVFFALVGISMTLLGLNMIATIVTMRAPGLTWTRLPIFVWGVISTSALMVLAAPVLIAALLDGAARPHRADELLHTRGRRQRLPVREPLLGLRAPGGLHPRAARASRSCSRSCPCSRASRSGATGSPSRGCSACRCCRWFVWQHHLFVSGINGDLRPFYMLSTELISIPTGLHLHLRDDDALARADPLHGADAVLPRVVLQLPDRRAVRASSSPTCRAT